MGISLLDMPSAVSTMLQGLLAQHPMTGGPLPPAPPSGGAGAAPATPSPTVSVGGITAPAPQALPLPMQQVAPQPSIFDRVKEHLGGLLDGPQAPSVYSGLLSPDEIQSAQPGIMARLASIAPGAPTPTQTMQAKLDHMVQLHQMVTQTAENKRILENRRMIEQRFPLPPNASMDQIRNNLAQRYDAYIGAGDGEMAKEIGQSLRGIMAVPKEDPFKTAAPGSTIYDPKTGKVVSTVPGADKSSDYRDAVDPQGNVHSVRKDQDLPPGWRTIPQQTTEVRIDASQKAAADRADLSQKKFDQQQINQGVTRFDRNTKDLRDRSRVIDQALVTIEDAAHNPNPAVRKSLYTSAVANFIQAADQKAQIRYQLLQYFKNNVDPSISGKWEVLKSRLLNGTLPQYSLEAMLQHLQNIKGLVQNEYEAQKAGEVKRHPELDGELPEVSEFFPLSAMRGSTKPATTGASDLYAKYGLTPKKP